MATFTQKHYEALMGALAQEPATAARAEAVRLLCRVFQRDNPRFQPRRFERGVAHGWPIGVLPDGTLNVVDEDGVAEADRI